MTRGVVAVGLSTLLWAGIALGDEEPIAGPVKAVNAEAQTLVIESTAKGKTRQVTVHLKPGAKIVRFVRASEPGKSGFVEQPMRLTDLKPGWVVSVTTRHEDGKEVADSVKVVLER